MRILGLLTHSLLLAQHQLDIEDLGAVAKGINKAKRAKSKKVTKQSSDPSSESSDASEVAINPRPPRASREEGTEASAGGCGSDDEAANGDDDDGSDELEIKPPNYLPQTVEQVFDHLAQGFQKSKAVELFFKTKDRVQKILLHINQRLAQSHRKEVIISSFICYL